MKKAFTFAEVMIVVAILGILAALVIPQFRSQSQEAKETAAKDNLRILRQQIEVYAAQHGGVAPGFPSNDATQNPTFIMFLLQMTKAEHYLTELPANALNGLKTIRVLGNAEEFPVAGTDGFGWVYKPAIKQIRLDSPGTDKDGNSYFDY